MRFTLSSRLIATFTAATIAVTSLGAAPAYADHDDRAARALATFLGAAVIGAIIIDKKKDKKSKRREVYQEPVRKKRLVQQHRTQRIAPRALPRRVHRNLTARDCRRGNHAACFRAHGHRANRR